MAQEKTGEFGVAHLKGAVSKPAARAYVTLLAGGRAGYGDFRELGAVRMAKALREDRAGYPLVVAVLPDVPDDLRRLLAQEGCIVREVCLPNNQTTGHLAVGYSCNERDAIDYYSKLCCIFQIAEYERMVYLDAARIQALENMGNLFELEKGFLYAWMEYLGDEAWARAPQYKIAYGKEESPDMVARCAAYAELVPILCNAAVLVHEPGMPFGEAFLGKNRAAQLGALYSNGAVSGPREYGMPLGEPLLGKNRAAELGALYSVAAVSAREHGMALAAGLSAPYSNGSVFAVQVSIDEAVGAKAGGPIAVGAKAAGADAGDARGRAGNLSAVVGIVAASSAVTAVAAGTVSPALAFGFFVVLLGGLSLGMSTIRGGGA